jgi:hypothetical protein
VGTQYSVDQTASDAGDFTQGETRYVTSFSKKGGAQKAARPLKSKHMNQLNLKKAKDSDDDSDNEDKLVARDGRKLTVAEFLADVELLKANKTPINMTIGLGNSELQKYKDEESSKLAQKDRSYAKRVEIEQARRFAEELQNKKRRQLAVYEKLEKELTRFEVEEEEDEMELSKLIEKI